MQEVAGQLQLFRFGIALFVLSDHRNLRGRAVDRVSNNRMADRGEMHADLMRAASFDANGQEGEFASAPRSRP